jgi:hypothetical protein
MRSESPVRPHPAVPDVPADFLATNNIFSLVALTLTFLVFQKKAAK